MTEAEQEDYNEPRGFASRLARTIREYWRQRGHDVNVDIKQIWRGTKRYNIIVSDLIDGLPPGRARRK